MGRKFRGGVLAGLTWRVVEGVGRGVGQRVEGGGSAGAARHRALAHRRLRTQKRRGEEEGKTGWLVPADRETAPRARRWATAGVQAQGWSLSVQVFVNMVDLHFGFWWEINISGSSLLKVSQ